jgi:hypothetical protein
LLDCIVRLAILPPLSPSKASNCSYISAEVVDKEGDVSRYNVSGL